MRRVGDADAERLDDRERRFEVATGLVEASAAPSTTRVSRCAPAASARCPCRAATHPGLRRVTASPRRSPARLLTGEAVWEPGRALGEVPFTRLEMEMPDATLRQALWAALFSPWGPCTRHQGVRECLRGG
ncbi:MAG: hypothetical protein GY835_09185 [bacterium]|nr:hypothetical protein [bacterium]